MSHVYPAKKISNICPLISPNNLCGPPQRLATRFAQKDHTYGSAQIYPAEIEVVSGKTQKEVYGAPNLGKRPSVLTGARLGECRTMRTDGLESELLALKQQALAADIGGVRDRFKRGELQWLRDHMPAGRYAHLGVALDNGDVESVRRDLASVELPVSVTNIASDPVDVRRSMLLQSQRNGLIAVAVIVALALLGLIGYFALRNKDESTDTTVPIVIISDTISDTVASTINPVTPNKSTVDSSLSAVSSTGVLAPVSTVSAAASQPPEVTVQTTVQSTRAPSAAPPVTAAGERKSDVLAAAERSATFGNFLAMIDAAGLREEIQGLNPSTVLAPTESAFSSLPVEVQAGLKSPSNKAILTRIVRYNVIPQAITLSQFTTSELKSFEGSTLKVVVGNNRVVINDATVIGADVATMTGVLHAVDKLLIPPGVSLNALVAKPIPSATAAPQTSPASIQPVSTIVSATQPIATTAPPVATQAPVATQTQPVATTTFAPTTTNVP
jgi:uncharacterized surface protein with fasciclin (FAS1) repeats